ncbi:hypothetical protein [Kitasatospora sp. NPDC057015]|uniref:hypothetical protein n=1 Tax=Kitasatospora sp. NPDC057015 TaxID=3346001 RepID=UPI00362F118E
MSSPASWTPSGRRTHETRVSGTGNGAAPFGSDGRPAFDQSGRRWQVTIAAPTAGDPRACPTPVLATRRPSRPDGEPITPLYVLAADVNASRAAGVIALVQGPAALADITAALH